MKIELKSILVKDLIKGFSDSEDKGCIGFDGKLNIRPAYQREFIYAEKQQAAVIDSIRNGFPLNVMYWSVNNDGTFEVIDGQQRTLSICNYIKGGFTINDNGNPRFYHNLKKEEQDVILNYSLQVYYCTGTDVEKLNWFKTINVAGEKLADQELRNAVYSGPFVTEAKKYFSKTGCPAYKIADKYMKGSPIRQDYLEATINWISNGDVEGYMASHQHEKNANELWIYFQNVITWVSTVFPNYQKEMKGLPWGMFYNKYKTKAFDHKSLKAEIDKLMADDDVTKKSGIYEYLLSGKESEKSLSIRAFTDSQKRTAFAKSGGVCPICNKKFKFEEMEADHIKPWHLGGKTTVDNLQMICKSCNRTKSGK